MLVISSVAVLRIVRREAEREAIIAENSAIAAAADAVAAAGHAATATGIQMPRTPVDQ